MILGVPPGDLLTMYSSPSYTRLLSSMVPYLFLPWEIIKVMYRASLIAPLRSTTTSGSDRSSTFGRSEMPMRVIMNGLDHNIVVDTYHIGTVYNNDLNLRIYSRVSN